MKPGCLGNLTQEQEQTLEEFKKNVAHFNLDPVRYDDHAFLRFLRARKFDVSKALDMFNKYMQWRQEFGTDHILEFSFPEVVEMRKFYPHGHHKTDKSGRPIYIERLGQLKIQDLFQITNEDRLLKYYVREYERLMLAKFPACSSGAGKHIETSLTILDLSGISTKLMNKQVYNFIKIASSVSQDYYPEILGNMFIVNAPSLFTMVWSTVKGFIDPQTRSKIGIYNKNYSEELFKLADPESIPEFLGGKCNCPRGCLNQNIGPWNPKGKPVDETGAVIPSSSEESEEEVPPQIIMESEEEHSEEKPEHPLPALKDSDKKALLETLELKELWETQKKTQLESLFQVYKVDKS